MMYGKKKPMTSGKKRRNEQSFQALCYLPESKEMQGNGQVYEEGCSPLS